MSSSSNIEDRAKDILREEIDQLIELQDQGIRLTEKKTEVVERMARKLEASGMEPDKICATIKRILKQNYIEISDWTVEKACGINLKQKHDRYQERAKSEETSDFQQPVTVSTTGHDGREEFYEGEPAQDMPEFNQESREVALSLAQEFTAKAKEQEIRLNEALKLADDKDKRIYELEMQAGELEMTIADLNKKSFSAPKDGDVDKAEELQIENDNLKQSMIELQEALRANIKSTGFTAASHLPAQVWISAINAMNFYRALNRASRHAIDHNDPWKKLVFDVSNQGELKAARLDGDADST